MNRFRKGSSTYKCQCCGKLTRETGASESSARLCVVCYELAGIDNFLTDNGGDLFREEYGHRVAEIFSLRPELESEFPALSAAIKDGLHRV